MYALRILRAPKNKTLRGGERGKKTKKSQGTNGSQNILARGLNGEGGRIEVAGGKQGISFEEMWRNRLSE